MLRRRWIRALHVKGDVAEQLKAIADTFSPRIKDDRS